MMMQWCPLLGVCVEASRDQPAVHVGGVYWTLKNARFVCLATFSPMDTDISQAILFFDFFAYRDQVTKQEFTLHSPLAIIPFTLLNLTYILYLLSVVILEYSVTTQKPNTNAKAWQCFETLSNCLPYIQKLFGLACSCPCVTSLENCFIASILIWNGSILLNPMMYLNSIHEGWSERLNTVAASVVFLGGGFKSTFTLHVIQILMYCLLRYRQSLLQGVEKFSLFHWLKMFSS